MTEKKPPRKRIAVAFSQPVFGQKREAVLVLSGLMMWLSLFVFWIAFNQVGGPRLDRNLAVSAAQSLVTAAGILGAASFALFVFYLERFFVAAEPFIQHMEPSVMERLYNSITPEQRNRLKEVMDSGEDILQDPELGEPFERTFQNSVEMIRYFAKRMMKVYPTELKRDTFLTLGLLVTSILCSIGSMVSLTSEFLALAIGALLGGVIALAQSLNDAQDGFREWLVSASVYRVARKGWKLPPSD